MMLGVTQLKLHNQDGSSVPFAVRMGRAELFKITYFGNPNPKFVSIRKPGFFSPGCVPIPRANVITCGCD